MRFAPGTGILQPTGEISLSCCLEYSVHPFSSPQLRVAPRQTRLRQTALRTQREFVGKLASADFTKAVDTFDATMRGALPEPKLRTVWSGLIAQAGVYVKQGATRNGANRWLRHRLCNLRIRARNTGCKSCVQRGWEKSACSSCLLAPAPASNIPPYVTKEAFDEGEITFGEEPWVLPGTISLPKGDGPFPAGSPASMKFRPARPRRNRRGKQTLPRYRVGPGLARHRRAALREANQTTCAVLESTSPSL